MFDSKLNPEQRADDLSRLGKEHFDVLVIGGGINGVGVALDAITRGLSVALIETEDFASGTSSRSSKLIHGGLRYLEQYDFKLVREALHERELLVSSLAPHLVKPVAFLYPLQEKVKERTYVGAGLALYDALRGFKRALPGHKHLSHKTKDSEAQLESESYFSVAKVQKSALSLCRLKILSTQFTGDGVFQHAHRC